MRTLSVVVCFCLMLCLVHGDSSWKVRSSFRPNRDKLLSLITDYFQSSASENDGVERSDDQDCQNFVLVIPVSGQNNNRKDSFGHGVDGGQTIARPSQADRPRSRVTLLRKEITATRTNADDEDEFASPPAPPSPAHGILFSEKAPAARPHAPRPHTQGGVNKGITQRTNTGDNYYFRDAPPPLPPSREFLINADGEAANRHAGHLTNTRKQQTHTQEDDDYLDYATESSKSTFRGSINRQDSRVRGQQYTRTKQTQRTRVQEANREQGVGYVPYGAPAPKPTSRVSINRQDSRLRNQQTTRTQHQQYSSVPEVNTATNTALRPEMSSPELLASFRLQLSQHQDDELPPALIDRSIVDLVSEPDSIESSNEDSEEVGFNYDLLPSKQDPQYTSRVNTNLEPGRGQPEPSNQRQNTPSTPSWDFSMTLRAELKVPMSDYSEPYDIWYNSDTGETKTDFHNGGTQTYRMATPDGLFEQVAIRTDRLGETNVVECHVAPVQKMSRAQLGVPGLPDMAQFQFNGYMETSSEKQERWSRKVEGRDGEMGASAGERLTFHHDMLVKRSQGRSIPVMYSVRVDSSILGKRVDEYTHRYHEVEPTVPAPDAFHFDIDNECQRKSTLNMNNPEEAAFLDPLKEFTLPGRDQRYDVGIQSFKTRFQRNYIDNVEESLRKSLFIKNSRFVVSGNRESATFELEVNFLGDRLAGELQQLLGVRWEDAALADGEVEPFPHAAGALRAQAGRLPKAFDWRPRGAVSEVRWQGSCASCWAFAVAGAVEGALFVRKGALVPLSEQCLVDCGQPFGTHGCSGTWPRFAYNYVKARGLPAIAEYGPYKEKEEKCRKVSPVTHISAYVNVTQRSVPALKIAIRKHSPSVVIVDAMANSFIFYKKGVLYDDRCGKTLPQLNHAVLAVGWGHHRAQTHFILKNSWSAAWGEQGFIRVQGDANTCGVLEQPSYPRLEDEDVDQLPGDRDDDRR